MMFWIDSYQIGVKKGREVAAQILLGQREQFYGVLYSLKQHFTYISSHFGFDPKNNPF